MGIVVRTLSEQIVELVREQIVEGRFGPGGPIRQDALAAQLGISKIPLREALARLEQEGFVGSTANRGFFVSRMSLAEAEELFALRLQIEPGAAAFAAVHATAAERRAAQLAYEKLDHAVHHRRSDVAQYNRAFHLALVQAAGRGLTVELVERLAALAERYVVAYLEPAGRKKPSHHEHRVLLEVWLARDAACVERLLAAHIGGVLERLRQCLPA